MKITSEILERFGLHFSEGINEVEFLEAILKFEFPIKLFHYIRQYYRLTPEEFGAYCAVCRIKDSDNFWNCEHIENSKNLYNSFGVSDSSFIRDSNNIRESNNIYNSSEVYNSNDIAHSSYVGRSQQVIESQDVNDSESIARSSHINWSTVILNSERLDDCSYTYMSQDLVDCHFCGFVRNSRRCLFCVGLENKEYYIFNKPVTPKEYELVKEKLMSLLEEEKSQMIKIKDSKHIAEERFKLNRRFDSIIDGLSKDFFGWVGTLPNYSDDVYVDLFFRDREVN